MSKRRRPIGILALAIVCLASPIAQTIDANEKVYNGAVRSTVLILTSRGRGSGALVDVKNRYVLTAYHVTGSQATVSVIFPVADNDGRIINESIFYRNKRSELAITGTVVKKDKSRDVAVIQLPRLPAGVKAIPLAKESPRPGQDIHCIGNAAYDSGGMFGYCHGKVRNVFRRAMRGSQAQIVRIVETQIPTNKGDSGGPILNDQGELVAIVSTGTTGVPPPKGSIFYARQVVDHSVDVSEIRAVLAGRVTGDTPTKALLAENGELKQTDDKDRVRKGSFHKVYSVKLTQGKAYIVDLVSDKFDTYLRLENADGRQLAFNDDGGIGLNSRIVIRTAKNGVYRVIVTSYGRGATGPFQLTVRERD